MNHIEIINQLINDNSNKEPREIARLINKYCKQNPSINDIETRKLNLNIKLDGYHFAKTKNIVKIKAKSRPISARFAGMMSQCDSIKPKQTESEITLEQLMKMVMDINKKIGLVNELD